jgi:hypothetical protein
METVNLRFHKGIQNIPLPVSMKWKIPIWKQFISISIRGFKIYSSLFPYVDLQMKTGSGKSPYGNG